MPSPEIAAETRPSRQTSSTTSWNAHSWIVQCPGSASAKYFKESALWVKTKLPVAVVKTDNILPKDEFRIEKVDRRRKDEAED